MKSKAINTEKELDLIIGAQLKALRIAEGLSQTELGQQAGISFQQVQKCERGLNRIGAGRLWQFCQILGVHPNQFFDQIENLNSSKTNQRTNMQEWSEMLSRQNFSLIKNFSRIKDYALKISIIRICEGLAENPSQ